MKTDNVKFFEWVANCCTKLGKDRKYGVLLCEDPNWLAAFKDGMTEDEAIAEFKVGYPNGYPKEIEDEYLG